MNPRRPLSARLLLFCLIVLFIGGCARYVPVPWQERAGRAESVEGAAFRLLSALDKGTLARMEKEPALFEGVAADRGRPGGRPRLRVVVAGFPEARTGFRTGFSRRIEAGLRRALAGFSGFELVDEGEGVFWQEASFGANRVSPPSGRSGILGGLGEAAQASGRNGGGDLDRQLDADHPTRGLWPKAKKGTYGENSAVYAASMVDADAAVFGAYALGPDRLRIWAALVRNGPPRTTYYIRGLRDIMGEPERLKRSRVYYAVARDQIPREAVPERWLATWVPPVPRMRPTPPPHWAERTFEVRFERIGRDGKRHRVGGGARLGPRDLLVGRLAVGAPRYVYGFALDDGGALEEVIAAAGGGGPRRVEPGREARFVVRLHRPGRGYRVYFVSSADPFAVAGVVRKARLRLGLAAGGRTATARTFRDAARGLPPRRWYVRPGQEGLILGGKWDHQANWFYRERRE